MEMLNQIILYIMMTFMVIGALDRIMQQFGGSQHLLGKVGLGGVGKSIAGAGNQFEEGFNAMGALALAMVGIIAIAPVLAKLLSPVVVPVYTALGADPAMFATTLLANDMGGYFLAKEMATAADGTINYGAWMYAGLILGAMMGPTIVFSIPVAVGIIDVKDRPYLAAGVLAGMVTIPLGCIAGGLSAMASTVTVPGTEQVIEFNLPLIFMNLIPVIIVSALIATGLWLIPERMINGFSIFAKFLVAFITVGLTAAVLERTLGFALIPGMDPIFMVEGDVPGLDMRAIEVIGSIAIILLGAYPMVLLLTRWFEKPLLKMGGALHVNPTAATGLIATLANNIPMFQVMRDMDSRGKILCSAFAVSAAFTFGDHLGFTAANKPDMIMAVIIGKLVGGITAVLFAMLVARKMIDSIEKTSDDAAVDSDAQQPSGVRGES
ncbi:ethanolamine utilization protein EutH [Exilibacterium tricleocarpae]|uniref:Ethanolamine utilization protein EutH n=1 Tax=Exilibacterium tricleocarpae TaxID=2591008 RepID=A0A545TV76_9GAMM|nr:ethanolamine utilization protein EutH [Exilibacterium tricleocarpae]TQV81125.1 ethanolamine utilization protein EutH [Exilibacterium tricleocarpae]